MEVHAMNKQQVKGVTNQVTGEIKEQVGKMTGDRSTEARGHAREIKGKLQKSVGDTRETLREDRDLDQLERDRLESERLERERRHDLKR
jgi:uncharacterized protein YjbJ (UPF0337 family)